MTHLIGQTVLQYKTVEKLGEGGMGVVYKAEDTKLRRTVALKFLPHDIESHESERARFLQEAQAAAVLNHPNICTVYDIQEYEGEQFIVMEYVDGKTLRQMVPIQKMQTAIDYAIQIGEALQEAHSKGIVHRDIKTDNIMVNSKNQIKVMDFGLAKLRGSLKLTKSRSTVGTLAYMAPEQIQGGNVDARSDIFSFGVVLYEMLTGELPFKGEHEAGIMYSILNQEPESIEVHIPEIPAELVHVIGRALEKDPEERYQSVGEMSIDLRRLKKTTSKVSRTPDPTTLGTTRPRRIGRLTLLGAVVLSIVGAAIFVLTLSPRIPEFNPAPTVKPLDIPFTDIQYPAISSDGNWLAFPACHRDDKWDIYMMHTSGGEPRRITNESFANMENLCTTSISPDGSLIAYNRLNTKTNMSEGCIVPALGGEYRVILDAGVNLTWRPDGNRLGFILASKEGGGGQFIPSQSGLSEFWTVRPDGKDKRCEFVDSLGREPSLNMSFSWSPDGRSVAWLRTTGVNAVNVITRELSTGKERIVTHDNNKIDEVRWASNGMIFYSSNRGGSTNIWMVPVEGGESIQVTKGEGPDVSMTLSADCRRMVYFRRRTVGVLSRVALDGSETKQLTLDNQRIGGPSFSIDRQLIAYSIFTSDEIGSNSGLYVMDREGENRRQIVPADSRNFGASWSPDGKWFVYAATNASAPPESPIVYLLDGSLSGVPKAIARGSSPRWIDSRTIRLRGSTQFYRVDITTGKVDPIFRDSTFALPVLGGKVLFVYDLHAGRGGYELRQLGPDPNSRKSAPQLLPELDDDVMWVSADLSFVLCIDKKGEFWKFPFASRRKERVPAKIPEHSKVSGLATSYDNKEMLYVLDRVDAKLVLIENLFK